MATTSESGRGHDHDDPGAGELTNPQAARALDQAPVTVNITTASVTSALAVPVTRWWPGRRAGTRSEVGPGSTRRWVPVTPGIFDDAAGLVQVTGALRPGEHVVVPAS